MSQHSDEDGFTDYDILDCQDDIVEQEMEFRDRVQQDLVEAIRDFLTFASVEELEALIEGELQ